MELLKLLNTSEIAAQIVSFLLLLFLSRIFFWNKILVFLDQRKERIAAELRSIEETKSGVEVLKSDYGVKLSEIEKTANKKIQEGIEAGKKISDDIQKKAHEEAKKIIDNAKMSMKYELSQVKEVLKEEIVDLVIKATAEVIENKLTEEQDKKIIETFLSQIDKVND